MKKQTKITTERKYIHNIPFKKRVAVRQGLNKVKEHIKGQNALLTELYLMPNRILDEKIDLFLKGRICSEELNQTIDTTRKRYAEVLNLREDKNG